MRPQLDVSSMKAIGQVCPVAGIAYNLLCGVLRSLLLSMFYDLQSVITHCCIQQISIVHLPAQGNVLRRPYFRDCDGTKKGSPFLLVDMRTFWPRL